MGIWSIFELKYYLELSKTDYSNLEYVLIGTGSFMIAAGIIGCCATVKNIAWLLQLVSHISIYIVLFPLLSAKRRKGQLDTPVMPLFTSIEFALI